MPSHHVSCARAGNDAPVSESATAKASAKPQNRTIAVYLKFEKNRPLHACCPARPYVPKPVEAPPRQDAAEPMSASRYYSDGYGQTVTV